MQRAGAMRILFLSALLALSACSRSDPPPAPQPRASTSAKNPEAARRLVAAGAVVLDVRTPDEYADGHLPQATNIPVDTVGNRIAEIGQLAGGDRARAVVVYCAAGARAAKAKQILEDAGFTHVVNGGGYDDLR